VRQKFPEKQLAPQKAEQEKLLEMAETDDEVIMSWATGFEHRSRPPELARKL
jgi:hypothetical protein